MISSIFANIYSDQVPDPFPAIPGFEASGIIVDSGDNKKHLIGKKASCFIQGNDFTILYEP